VITVITTLPWLEALKRTRLTGETVAVVGSLPAGVHDLSDIVVGNTLDNRPAVTALLRKVPAPLKAPANPRPRETPASTLVVRLSLLSPWPFGGVS
jgi:hypothetical protein